MATDLGLLSLNQLQKLAQSHLEQNKATLNPNPSSPTGVWMWNPKQAVMAQDDDDDSWEVRAFQEDTNQAMGTTWPPRSYTCTFCKREFKSAQALGGHMNVHRRDRARLHHHQVQPGSIAPSLGSANSPALIFPAQEFMANGGLCLLYALPNPNSSGAFAPNLVKEDIDQGGLDSPTTLFGISKFPLKNFMSNSQPSTNFPVVSPSTNSSRSHSSNTEPSTNLVDYDNFQINDGSAVEELDLELRLGRNASWR